MQRKINRIIVQMENVFHIHTYIIIGRANTLIDQAASRFPHFLFLFLIVSLAFLPRAFCRIIKRKISTLAARNVMRHEPHVGECRGHSRERRGARERGGGRL